jgi:copper chaperone CopZ
MSIESNLKKLDGIENIVADVDKQTVTITGEEIDLDKVKDVVESIGYIYDGKVA